MGIIKKIAYTLAVALIATPFLASAIQEKVNRKMEEFENYASKPYVTIDSDYTLELISESYPPWRVITKPEIISSFLGDRNLNCAATSAVSTMVSTGTAERYLGKNGRNRAAEAVIRSWRNNTRTVQHCKSYFIEALGNIGGKEAGEILLKDLMSGKPDYETPEAIGKLRDKRAVPYLIRMLYDKNTANTLNHVFTALGDIGDKRALPHMFKKLGNSYSFFSFETALEDFSRIKGSEAYVNNALYLGNSHWANFIASKGTSAQKNALARVLIRRWENLSGGSPSLDRSLVGTSNNMFRLALNGDKRIRDKIADAFFHVAVDYDPIFSDTYCSKTQISFIKLEQMGEEFHSSRYRSLGKTAKSSWKWFCGR